VLTVARSFMNVANSVLWRMAIILKTNEVNLFLSSILFVFWYHSPNFLDTPRMSVGALGAHCAKPRMATNLYSAQWSVFRSIHFALHLFYGLLDGIAASSKRCKLIMIFVMSFGRLVPPFRRYILPPSAG
jgi:hypothetical protein